MKHIYNGVIYNSKKELREATGLSGGKIRGMIKSGVIKIVTD
jgi:hypothetical protein